MYMIGVQTNNGSRDRCTDAACNCTREIDHLRAHNRLILQERQRLLARIRQLEAMVEQLDAMLKSMSRR